VWLINGGVDLLQEKLPQVHARMKPLLATSDALTVHASSLVGGCVTALFRPFEQVVEEVAGVVFHVHTAAARKHGGAAYCGMLRVFELLAASAPVKMLVDLVYTPLMEYGSMVRLSPFKSMAALFCTIVLMDSKMSKPMPVAYVEQATDTTAVQATVNTTDANIPLYSCVLNGTLNITDSALDSAVDSLIEDLSLFETAFTKFGALLVSFAATQRLNLRVRVANAAGGQKLNLCSYD
jgi:hypothetical protein